MGRVRWAVWVAALGVFGTTALGCADYLSPQEEDRKEISLEGTIEVPTDARLPVTRILFLIDASQSMAVNDPDLERMKAVGDIISRFFSVPDIEFGLIIFNGQATALTGPGEVFTTRVDLLNEALAGLGQASGNTSYEAGLSLALTAVRDEATSLAIHDRQRTYFHLIFLSDGLPYPQDPDTGHNTAASITGQVEALKALESEFGLGGIRLHSTHLAVSTPDEIREAAAELLTDMARLGEGTYQEFDIASQVNFHALSLIDTPLAQAPTILLVLNRNSVPGLDGPLPDSDADGLGDSLEVSLGLNPLHRDSDGDGFGDRLESILGGFDPASANACSSWLDQDRDGLVDCEEEALGTSNIEADSDGDGLPDGIEIQIGSHPLQVDRPEDLWERAHPRTWSEVVDEGWFELEFRADKVPLVPTQTGHNSLVVWVDSLPHDPWTAPSRFQVACLDLAEPFTQLPDTLLLETADFAASGSFDWRPGGDCLPAEP